MINLLQHIVTYCIVTHCQSRCNILFTPSGWHRQTAGPDHPSTSALASVPSSQILRHLYLYLTRHLYLNLVLYLAPPIDKSPLYLDLWTKPPFNLCSLTSSSTIPVPYLYLTRHLYRPATYTWTWCCTSHHPWISALCTSISGPDHPSTGRIIISATTATVPVPEPQPVPVPCTNLK